MKKLYLHVSDRNSRHMQLPVEVYFYDKYQYIGDAMVVPGKRWAEVMVVYPAPDLNESEKDLFLRAIVEREPGKFHLEEEKDG